MDEIDQRCLEKMGATYEQYVKNNVLFDRMEMAYDLFSMNKIIYKINNYKRVDEILEAWEDYKVLEKRTRI